MMSTSRKLLIVVAILGVVVSIFWYRQSVKSDIPLSSIESIRLEERRIMSRYTSDRYGFEVQYPSGMRPVVTPKAGDEKLFTFHDNESGALFDVHVLMDEADSEEDVKSAFGNNIIDEVRKLMIGEGADILAFDFTYKDDSGYLRRGVWFSDGGYSFRASSPLQYEQILYRSLATWKCISEGCE